MDCLVNTSTPSSNWSAPNETVDVAKIGKWVFSRLRVFFYLSDPNEEMFEFEQNVADYHTEVSQPVVVVVLPLCKSFALWLVDDETVSETKCSMFRRC